MAKSQLDSATLIRTIRNTLAFHPQDQQIAPQSLRKRSRAVERSAGTIFITDLHGVIEYVNPAFENLTGQERDEVCGRTSRISKSSERAPEVYPEIRETILAGNSYRGIRGESKKEWRVVLRGREHLPGSGRLATGHAVPFEGRDLTERLRLEAQLLPSQKRDAMGNLAGGVAHDFNPVLTSITSCAELALDMAPKDAPLESKIQEILLAAPRAAELTHQWLAVSRKQPHGETNFLQKPCSLKQFSEDSFRS